MNKASTFLPFLNIRNLFINYWLGNPALLNLESKNQGKNIPVGLPGFPIKIWDKPVQGFLSYDRTNKETNRDYNFI